MKVIKPQKLGLLTRPFEHQRTNYLGVSVLAFISLKPPSALLSEVAMWKFVPEELGKEAGLDVAMPKSRSEFLVTGSAFVPGGQPSTTCPVQVRVGGLEKQLYVIGDRRWERGEQTPPEPFSQMPLGWENAFGGPEHKENPLGKGRLEKKAEKGALHALPNVVAPGKLITSPRQTPDPAGFGPIDMSWPQRMKKLGTYDMAWLKELFPAYAKDIDWTFFNLAAEDQQQQEPFVGTEAFRIDNMHPSKPVLEGQLPGLCTRVFINQKTSDKEDAKEQFREIGTKLTTIWFFPHAERAVLLFHGSDTIGTDDASDVLQIVAAAEKIGEPRPIEHYQAVLAKRLDKNKGAIAALEDHVLLPKLPAADLSDAPAEPMEAMIETEGLLAKNMLRKQALVIEAKRAEITAQGLDPDLYVPTMPAPMEAPPKDMEKLAAYLEEKQAEADEKFAELEKKQAEAQEKLKEIGDAPTGPPTFSAAAQMAGLQAQLAQARAAGSPVVELEQMAADPAYQQQLIDAEAQSKEGYRMMAHHQGEVDKMGPTDAALLRKAVLAAHEKGQSLAHRDFTGANFSGLDLQGANFEGCFMESVDFRRANLGGANFNSAVLARSDLSQANLSGAQFEGANLGAVIAVESFAKNANFKDAVLAKANLAKSNFTGSNMESADLAEAKFDNTDFSNVQAPELNFLNSDLCGLVLKEANLTKCNFLEVNVADVDFSGACLEGAVFLTATGQRAIFENAKMDTVRFVLECNFEGAVFTGASMNAANLRGTNLQDSNFSEAALSDADLSECNLQRSDLSYAIARRARFLKANLSEANLSYLDLMHGDLQKADIRNTNLSGANLYAVDFARVRGDDRTNLSGANQTKIRIHPKYEAPTAQEPVS